MFVFGHGDWNAVLLEAGSDVEEGKEENPDQVHKVPVDADVFDSVEKFSFSGIVGNDGHNDHSAKNVETMDASGDEIKCPEHAGGDGNGVVIRTIPVREDLRGILVKLNAHEDTTSEDGPPNILIYFIQFLLSSCLVGQDHEITGG
jgi:hypothetical protein